MEREVGGAIGMGNTCKPMAVSFQCMTKSTTNKKKEKEKVENKKMLKCKKKKKKTETDSYTESELVATEGERWVGRDKLGVWG